MFSHYTSRKISPFYKISTFSEDLSFLKPGSHLSKSLLLPTTDSLHIFYHTKQKRSQGTRKHLTWRTLQTIVNDFELLIIVAMRPILDVSKGSSWAVLIRITLSQFGTQKLLDWHSYVSPLNASVFIVA